MANGVIIPCAKKTEGSTNYNTITWKQRGNVVTVSIDGFTGVNGGAYNITGLPKAISDVLIIRFINVNGYQGYFQWYQNAFTLRVEASNVTMYGSMTYLTDE